MSSPFDRPAPPGDQFQAATHVGALLVIDVLEDVPPMVTKASKDPAPAIRANVYVISPQGAVAEEFANTLLWGKVLHSRLRQSVGRKVLGVLTGQPGVTRDGRNIPYDLDDPTDAMEEAAIRAMAAHEASRMQSAPATQWGQQPATPQAGPWGAQQQQPPPGWGQPPAGPPSQQGPPPGWGQPPAGPPSQQQPPPGWGQPPAQQGPPPGWGQQQPAPVPGGYGQQQLPEQPAAAPPWGQQPPAPAPAGDRPPWETDQQQLAPPWGGQQ